LLIFLVSLIIQLAEPWKDENFVFLEKKLTESTAGVKFGLKVDIKYQVKYSSVY
jgi:hypothetical protein